MFFKLPMCHYSDLKRLNASKTADDACITSPADSEYYTPTLTNLLAVINDCNSEWAKKNACTPYKMDN